MAKEPPPHSHNGFPKGLGVGAFIQVDIFDPPDDCSSGLVPTNDFTPLATPPPPKKGLPKLKFKLTQYNT